MIVNIRNIGEGTNEITVTITKKQFVFLKTIAKTLNNAKCEPSYCPELHVDEVEQ